MGSILKQGLTHKDEETLSKIRAIELWEDYSTFFEEYIPGSFKCLSFIHGYIFQDVYDFAGEMRSVDIAKGNFRFTPVIYLREALQAVEKLPQDTFDEIIEKYTQMNIAHPFREGNGRATRIWLDDILKANLGKCVDWSKVPKEAYISAMERSVVNTLEIKTLLGDALTENILDREVFMKGLDQSYNYEDLSQVEAKTLAGNEGPKLAR